EPSEKGFVSYDLRRGESRFHPVRTRSVVDLPPISAHDCETGEVIAAIQAHVSEAADRISGSIVRLTITDLPRPVLRDLEREVLRDLRSRVLHLRVDARPPRPKVERAGALSLRGHSLESQVEVFLA